MTRLRGQAGLTLPEILVAVLVGLIVLGSGVAVFVSFLTRAASSEGRTNSQDAVRLAVDQVAIQLRSAMSEGTPGSQPVVAVNDYSIVYRAPMESANVSNNPLGLRYVRYCLGRTSDGEEHLYRQTAPYDTSSNRNWPTSLGCPGGAWPNQLVVADSLVNLRDEIPLFAPRTDDGGNVTSIEIHAAVDVDPIHDPPATHLETAIEMRNVNRPPTAALTCQPAANGYALCDASASADPDGQSLSYSWRMSGSTLSSTSYRISQGGLVSGRSYGFEVNVTDSGGSTATASQSVTMP
jgi:Tfp pilus assembly protein PilV